MVLARLLPLITAVWVAAACLVGAPALASPDATPAAMDRLEEVLQLRIDSGELNPDLVMPTILVSAEPRYQVSVGWFATRAIEVIERTFGTGDLRLCEACMAPRTYMEDGNLLFQAGPAGLDEITRLDHDARGTSPPARTAIWLDEHRGGVSMRIVELSTGRVLFAQNIDPNLTEYANSQRMASLASELERRARGDAVAQTFVDIGLFPNQHISLDFTDQWGKRNGNLSGVTLSLVDPVFGVGVTHAHRLRFFNVLVGGKGVISLPTAVARGLGDSVGLDGGIIDPLITAVGFARVPFGRSNYGVVGTVSTNGRISVGISLLNVRILPVLP